jgi:tetratricopeptide (TPR) repeat protein
LPAFFVLLTLGLFAASWTVVRKDGSTIACQGPFVVVDGSYLCQDSNGKTISSPANEIDAAKTAAANRALSERPMPSTSIPPTSIPPQFPMTPEAAHAEALRIQQLLEARGFRELSELLTNRQAAFERDARLEAPLLDLFGLFASIRPGFGPALEEWVRQEPKSWIPLAAHGVHLAWRGWFVRGTAFSGRTSSQQFAAMSEFFRQAAHELIASLAAKPNIVAYYELIRLAKADPELAMPVSEYLKRALDLCPACFELRRQYMVGLEPRWGGTYEEMEQFAKESQRMAGANPQLRVLIGLRYADQGQSACGAGRYDEAVALHNQALSYGEYWNFFFGRAKALRCSHRYQEALLDLARAIALRPSKADLYIERAICHGLLHDTGAAWRDLDFGRVFPGEEGARDHTERWLRGLSPGPQSR